MSTIISARSMPVEAGIAHPDLADLPASLALDAPPWVSAPNDDARAFAALALAFAGPRTRTLDLGTGTGLLGVCLARAGWPVISTDVSDAAVRAARANAARHAVALNCRRSDLLADVDGPFDLIVFNPPFSIIPDNLALNVLKHLLRRSGWVRRRVSGSVPGLVVDFHRRLLARLVAQSRTRLAAGGAVLLHVYESEAPALIQSLPADVHAEVRRHPAMTPHGTVGLLLRFEHPALTTPAQLASLTAEAAA